ncbi:hypothetical protein K469DRAFT_755377 [Zopfia rhizophila CBS 207.26]|uniref:Uncharacterized protein n=1 Tax=Zopfia rhizophila CBS 207.26 TaxID=1314779 RepID=A0A6A6DFN1_9PEZI|nr:hypothetical protein K469DRAFT_755377 [Zopfia rhizophila CBS 207.26]
MAPTLLHNPLQKRYTCAESSYGSSNDCDLYRSRTIIAIVLVLCFKIVLIVVIYRHCTKKKEKRRREDGVLREAVIKEINQGQGGSVTAQDNVYAYANTLVREQESGMDRRRGGRPEGTQEMPTKPQPVRLEGNDAISPEIQRVSLSEGRQTTTVLDPGVEATGAAKDEAHRIVYLQPGTDETESAVSWES